MNEPPPQSERQNNEPRKLHTESVSSGAAALSSLGILATKLAAKPFNVVVSIIVANHLGPDDKGIAAWIVVLVSIAAYFFGFGCGSAIRFLLAGRSETLRELAWTSIAMGLLNGLIGSISLATMAHYDLMGPLSRELSPELRYTIIVCLPFLVIETILNRALIGESRYKFTNLVEFGSSFLYSLLLIFLVLVLHWELYGANLALFLTRGISVFATVFYVFRVYSPVFRIDWEVCYRSYNYGFRVWIGGMTVFMNMYLDSLIVGWKLPAAAMGNYSVAATIARSLTMLPQAINVVLTNRLIGLERRQAIEEAAMLHRSTFWLVIASALLLAIAGYVLLPLVMPTFRETPVVFLILLLGTICSASTTILNSYFASQGMPGRSSIAQLVGFVVGGALTPLFIGQWSGVGGAIGSSLTYLTVAGLMWYFFLRQDSRVALSVFAFRIADWNWMLGQIKAAWVRFRRTPT
ncbi:MAG: oligosaccharide flippase family protein [Planctomycetota bacterium]